MTFVVPVSASIFDKQQRLVKLATHKKKSCGFGGVNAELNQPDGFVRSIFWSGFNFDE
jgi:hypothetical protein